MKELITVNVGQTGVRLGNSLFQQYCFEHNLNLDGFPIDNEIQGNLNNSSIFYETSNGAFCPLNIFIDLDFHSIQEVSKSSLKNLYNKEDYIYGKEEGIYYSRSYYSTGHVLISKIEDRLRKHSEKCDSLQGIILNRSLGGGTGSGIGSRILEITQSDYPNKVNLGFDLIPSDDFSNSCIEPYNFVFSQSNISEISHCNILLQNDTIFRNLDSYLDIDYPKFEDVNELISKVITKITRNFRKLNNFVGMNSLVSNTVPFKRIKYLNISNAPFRNNEYDYQNNFTVSNMINSVFFEKNNYLNKPTNEKGLFIGCFLVYEGIFHKCEINYAIQNLKNSKKLNFVQYCNTGFKVIIDEINNFSSKVLQNYHGDSVCLLANHTSNFNNNFRSILKRFDTLLKKRTYLHWILQDGTEGEIYENRENLTSLEFEYSQII